MMKRIRKIKEVIFETYPNVFDFSIIFAKNNKDYLDVKLIIKKTPSAFPTKIHLIIKDNLEYELKEE